jgi:hypothetical protein
MVYRRIAQWVEYAFLTGQRGPNNRSPQTSIDREAIYRIAMRTSIKPGKLSTHTLHGTSPSLFLLT